eukprot:gene3577-4093_t
MQSYSWLNEPAKSLGDAKRLEIVTDENTDFWQKTFYGFERDNGHAYLTEVNGDFTLEAHVQGDYKHLYDQAGLMLRIDDKHWVKTGIEFTDGLMHFSVVLTNQVSDWSVIPLHHATPNDLISIRLTRHDDAIRIQYAINNSSYQMARLAPFSAANARAGVMACSPLRAGFEATFTNITISPPISRELH